MISFYDSRRAEYADGHDWMSEKQALRGVSALLREGLVALMIILFTAFACLYFDSLHLRIAFQKKLLLHKPFFQFPVMLLSTPCLQFVVHPPAHGIFLHLLVPINGAVPRRARKFTDTHADPYVSMQSFTYHR
jgi:hypothetical protein